MRLKPNTAATPPRRRGWRRRVFRLALYLCALLLSLYFAVPFAVNHGWLDGWVARTISRAAGMPTRLQRLQMDGWGTLVVDGLEMRGPPDGRLLRVFAQQGQIRFRLARIFGRRLESVAINGGQLEMRVAATDGASQPGQPFQWMNLPRLGAVTLHNCTATIQTASGLWVLEHADAQAQDADAPPEACRAAKLDLRVKRVVWKTAERQDVAREATLSAHFAATGPSQLATFTASFGVWDYLGANLRGSLSGSAQELEHLRASASGVDLAAFEKRFAEILPRRFPLQQFTGTLGLDIEADQVTDRGTGQIRLKARADNFGVAARLEGNDAQVARAALLFETTAKLERRFRSVTFESSAALMHPEIVWRDFRKRLDGEAAQVAASGRYDLDIGELSNVSARLALPSAVVVNLENGHARLGDAMRYGVRLWLRCDDLSEAANDWKQLLGLRSLEVSGGFALGATMQGDARTLFVRGETHTSLGAIRLQRREAPNAPESVLRLFYGARDLNERSVFEANVPLGDAAGGTVTVSTDVQVQRLEAPVAGEMEQLGGIALRLNADWDLRGPTPLLCLAKIEVADFIGAKIEASLASKDPGAREGLARITNLDLRRQWTHFRRLLPPGFDTSYAPSGALDLTVRYAATPEGGQQAVVDFGGQKIAVTSSRVDLPSGVENLKVRGTARVAFSDGFNKSRIAATIALSDPIVYHDKLFKDFSGHGATLQLSGEWDGAAARVSDGRIEIRAENVLTVEGRNLKADFLEKSFSGRIGVHAQDLAPIFEGLVRETYQVQVPALRQAQVGGAMQLEVAVAHSQAGFVARGQAQLEEVSASVAGLSVEQMSGTVPLVVNFPRRGSTPSESDCAGASQPPDTLSIRRLAVGEVAAENLEVVARISDNRLVLEPLVHRGLPQCLEAVFLGGTLTASEFQTSDLFAAPRKLEATFQLREVDCAPVFKALGLPPYQGTVNSAPCRLVFTEDDVSLEGTLTAAICGGTVSLSGARFTDYLGVAPVVRLDLEFGGLDLSQLTSRLNGFGVVQGVLAGRARRLLLQQGRPYSLDLELRTVKSKSAKQLIDRSAVRSLLILATGERQPQVEPLLMFGGIKYRIFGIKCQINDDEVLIEGVEKRGDRHIVFDSAPLAVPQLTISVLTGRPISYDDLLARLKAAAEDAKKKKGDRR